MVKDRVKIDPEFRALIPPLSDEERRQLEENIKADGCREALVTWRGLIADGHNRQEICERLGINYETTELDAVDRDAVKVWIIRNQLGRRNLTPFVRVELALLLEPLLVTKAKENQRQSGGAVVQKSVKPPIKVQGELAKAAKVSHDTVHKAKAIAKSAPEAVKAKLRSGETSINKVYTDIKRQEQTEKRREKRLAELKDAPPASSTDWQLIHGDSVAELAKLPAKSARLVFADPPYNLGFDYGDGADADSLDDEKYMAWVGRWVKESARALTDDGSLWVMISDEYAAEYNVLLKSQGFSIRNWIIWHETFGVNCTNKFNRCHRHIFYAVKDPKRFVFNVDEPLIRRESDRQAIYGDKRAASDGKLVDDVWLIPRLTGTATERIPDFPTQLPLELVKRIVAAASNPGDTIVDPFNGSGTTGVVAIELGRKYIGIEKQKKFHELATLRLRGAA